MNYIRLIIRRCESHKILDQYQVNERQKVLINSVMERCENLRVRFVKELDDYKAFDDDVAQKARFIETGFETMEEFSDSVQKLLSMYDLERFIAEQERLIKRVPELEEEVRRLKPREDQLLEQIKENDKMSSDLQSKLQMATNDLRSASSGLESQKGRLSLLQDEVDRFTAKIAAQTKAEAKVREALGASQKETAKIEEILQEKKAEFEAAFKDMQERHEKALDEMKEAADQAAEE